MIKFIKDFLAKRKQKRINAERVKKIKEYYKLIHRGSLFLKFIMNDLNSHQSGLSRSSKRRISKSISEQKINKEIIEYYNGKIENILTYVESHEDALQRTIKKKTKINTKNNK